MATINNLQEFFEARGFEVEANTMWQWAKQLYKASFGPWVSYLIKVPTDDQPFEFRVVKEGEKLVYHSDEPLPDAIIRFFILDRLEDGSHVGDYADLVLTYAQDNKVNWQAVLSLDPDTRGQQLTVKGIHKAGTTIRRVYYESREASEDTLKLAPHCCGIQVGSIVEGCDFDATPFDLHFPFKMGEFEAQFQRLGDEVEAAWKHCNSTYYQITFPSGKVIYCQWVQGEEAPQGNFAEDDKETSVLAKAAGHALRDSGVDLGTAIAVPCYPGYWVKENEPPCMFEF